MEVTLKVNGVGTKQILGSDFPSPNYVYINGANKDIDSSNQIVVNNGEQGSPIQLIWRGVYLISSHKMFEDCTI